MGVASSITVACDNNHTPETSPTKCGIFYSKRIFNTSSFKMFTWWDINIMLVLTEMEMGVIASEIGILSSICDLPNANIF